MFHGVYLSNLSSLLVVFCVALCTTCWIPTDVVIACCCGDGYYSVVPKLLSTRHLQDCDCRQGRRFASFGVCLTQNPRCHSGVCKLRVRAVCSISTGLALYHNLCLIGVEWIVPLNTAQGWEGDTRENLWSVRARSASLAVFRFQGSNPGGDSPALDYGEMPDPVICSVRGGLAYAWCPPVAGVVCFRCPAHSLEQPGCQGGSAAKPLILKGLKWSSDCSVWKDWHKFVSNLPQMSTE